MILSLDQALVTTGWAIFDKKKLIAYDSFTINGKDSIEKRLGFIFQKLTELYNKYKFDYLVFEDIQQQQNPSTYKKLAYVQAIILFWCFYNQINFTVLSPSQWRKNLGGNFGRKREEQKQKAINLVKQYYNIDVNSDIADAICIGKAYLDSYKQLGFGVV